MSNENPRPSQPAPNMSTEDPHQFIQQLDEYEALHKHSTQLVQELEELGEMVETPTQEPTSSNRGTGSDGAVLSASKEKQLRQLVSTLHLDVASIDELDTCRRPIRKATDELEVVLTHLTHLSSLTTEQRAVIHDMTEFFHNSICRHIALNISQHTGVEPNNTLHARTESFRQKRITAGFTPSTEEFATNENNAAMEAIHNMARNSLSDPNE